MRLWRCVHRQHMAAAWSGDGAKAWGGRWNRKGRAMVYASEHAALAVLEVLVRLDGPQSLEAWRLVSTDVETRDAPLLEPGDDAQAVGNAFLESGALVARVDSQVVPGRNYLINPEAEAWDVNRRTEVHIIDTRLAA